MKTELDEPSYRKLVDDTFKAVDAAFEHVDPDLAESEYLQGTLTITLNEKVRLILSPQTPVRQIWVAYKDRAWHLDWHGDNRVWLDDRKGTTELMGLVRTLVVEAVGPDTGLAL